MDLVDEDGTFLDRANAPERDGQQRRADDRDQRRGQRRTRARSTRLTLGAVTDPGTDTVTSYIVHWGDGNTDTYTHRRRQDAHLRRRPEQLRHHRGPGRRGRHLPRPRQRRSASRSTTWRRRSPSAGRDASTKARPTRLTLGAVTDPGDDTVTSYVVHWGDGTERHLHAATASRRTPTPTAPNSYDHHRRPGGRGRHVPRPANALGVTVNNVAPTIAISGAASVDEGSTYSLTLGAVTDPGTDTVTSYIVALGRRRHRHLRAPVGVQDAHLRRRPQQLRPSRSTWSTRTARSSTRPTRTRVKVANVAPTHGHQRRGQRQRGRDSTRYSFGRSPTRAPTRSRADTIHWGDGNTRRSLRPATGVRQRHPHLRRRWADDDRRHDRGHDSDGATDDGTTCATRSSVTVDNVDPTVVTLTGDRPGQRRLDPHLPLHDHRSGRRDRHPRRHRAATAFTDDADFTTGDRLAGSFELHLRRRPAAQRRRHRRPTATAARDPTRRRVTVNNVAPTIAISGAASVNEGSAYSLTLGAVTDPGTDTVTSYIVHWGDGNTDTYTHRRRQDPHLRRRPQHLRHHGRPGRRGRHLPRPRQRPERDRQQRGADHRDQRRGQRRTRARPTA